MQVKCKVKNASKQNEHFSGKSSDPDGTRTRNLLLRRQLLYPIELRDLKKIKSGWQDSNLRPHGPKPCAITGLRYTPNLYVNQNVPRQCVNAVR
jgi:hypothetical protein